MSSDKKTLLLTFKNKSYKILENLKEKLGVEKDEQALWRSLLIIDLLLAKIDTGSDIFVVDSDGTVSLLVLDKYSFDSFIDEAKRYHKEKKDMN